MNARDEAVAGPGVNATARSPHGGRWMVVRFGGHAIAMLLAMSVGMGLGSLLGIRSVPGTELRATLWLIAMCAPMVAWMRLRRHTWRPVLEMCAAMCVPLIVALPVYWGGVISGQALLGIEHGLMAPAMLGAMIYRRRMYGWTRGPGGPVPHASAPRRAFGIPWPLALVGGSVMSLSVALPTAASECPDSGQMFAQMHIVPTTHGRMLGNDMNPGMHSGYSVCVT